jgi:cytochrome c oxidase subunit 4
VIVAVGIAITKATLVVLYFMHARYAGGLTGIVIAAGGAFFFILIFLTLSDYVTRSWSLTAAG